MQEQPSHTCPHCGKNNENIREIQYDPKREYLKKVLMMKSEELKQMQSEKEKNRLTYQELAKEVLQKRQEYETAIRHMETELELLGEKDFKLSFSIDNVQKEITLLKNLLAD